MGDLGHNMQMTPRGARVIVLLEAGAGGVSPPTSSQRKILLCLNRRLT